MEEFFEKISNGYRKFRQKYAVGNKAVMKSLSYHGQRPKIMIIACCDSRVDPAVILQCDPGDLFVVRNIANIVPPYEKDTRHHGTSAALEFGIKCLHIKNLILLGHSQCAGIQMLIENNIQNDDFITNWVSIIKSNKQKNIDINDYSKLALQHSYNNCMTFPWIADKYKQGVLQVYLWFFDIKTGVISQYSNTDNKYYNLDLSIA